MTDLAAFLSGTALVMLACTFPRPVLATAAIIASIPGKFNKLRSSPYELQKRWFQYLFALHDDGSRNLANFLIITSLYGAVLSLAATLMALGFALDRGAITILLWLLVELPYRAMAVFVIGCAAGTLAVFAVLALVEAVWRKIESRDDVHYPFTPAFSMSHEWRLYALFGRVPGGLPAELARGPYGKARLSAFGNNFPWTATIGQGLLDQDKVTTRYYWMWNDRAAFHLHPAGKDLSTEDVHAVNFNYTASNVNEDICIGFNACYLEPHGRAPLGERLVADVVSVFSFLERVLSAIVAVEYPAIARIVLVALASAAWSKLAPVVFGARDAVLFAVGVVTGLAGFAYDTTIDIAQRTILAAQRDLGLVPVDNSIVGSLVVLHRVAQVLAAEVVAAVRPSVVALVASFTAVLARADKAIADAIPQLGSVGGALALQARDGVYARLVCMCTSLVQRVVRFALRLPGMLVDHVFGCIASLAVYAAVSLVESVWALCPSWQQVLHIACRLSVHPALLVLRVAFLVRTVVHALAAAMLVIVAVMNWATFLVYCVCLAIGGVLVYCFTGFYSLELWRYVGFAVLHAVRSGEWHVVWDRLVDGIDFREDAAYCVKWNLVDVAAYELRSGPSRWLANEEDFRVSEGSTSRVDHEGRLISMGLDGSYRFYTAKSGPVYH